LALIQQGPSRECQAARGYGAGHLQLLAALGPVRPVEARLSGLDAWFPYRRPSREGRLAHPRIERAVGAATAAAAPFSPGIRQAVVRAARRQPSPENLAVLGVLDLVTGNPDQAIQELRKALGGRSDDPSMLNDLAAALLARSADTDEPDPAGKALATLEALEAAQRSLRSQPSPAGLFNAALALERLGLHTRAVAAWRRYLEEDSRSGWAREAAEHLDRLEYEPLEGRIVAGLLAAPATELQAFGRNPWADRQFGEGALLARWAARILAGDPAGAEVALAEAESLAAALTAGGGRLIAASALAIREAERPSERELLQRLALGHAAYARAWWLWRSERSPEAHELALAAAGDLATASSPFELRARLLAAVAAAAPAWAEIELVEQRSEEMGFPSLGAEARRQAADRMSREGRFAAALDAYEDARRRFIELGEHEAATVVTAMRAELFDAIGNQPREMAELAAALAGASALSDPWNRYSTYVVAASATASSFRRAAVELRREAAGACRDLTERPLCAIDSLLWVARLTPDAELAEAALARAAAQLPSLPESEGKERTAIDLAAARAHWLGGEDRSAADQEGAAELFADVARRYQARALVPSATRARAARAAVLERLGRTGESLAEYREVLQVFRRWDQSDRFRPEIADRRVPPELRAVYERLLASELDAAAGKPASTAFLLAEEMRDHLAPRRTAALDLPQAADLARWLAAVPAGTAVVEYAMAGGRATAWILAGGRLAQVPLAPAPGLVECLREIAGEHDPAAWKSRTGALFHQLVAPVLTRLPAGAARLVVVPDADLYGLPFRALWDGSSGRYLDEELVLSLAPSVRMALDPPARRPSPAPPRPLAALSLGFGEFAPQLGLASLPRAVAEAAAVRAVYAGGRAACLVNDWESFRRCAPSFGVIHLSTHAAAGPTPSGSWLAWPRETVNLDRLWSELPELPERPLVVLSSCESAAVAAGGEGLGGLARPFLASGARAVVGTLWKIDDEDASCLFPALHRAYARHPGDAAQALRTMRELTRDWRQRPWVWGGVEVVSGQPSG
jgi:hypothetical protein